MFNRNVKSVLLYACESWRSTNQITRRLQIFVNICLRRIMNIKWTNKITSKELRSIRIKQKIIYKRRKWNRIGHTLRKETGATEKTALDLNPQGYSRRGRANRTWRRSVENGIRNRRISWNEVKWTAGDRNTWKPFMDALCSTGSKRI